MKNGVDESRNGGDEAKIPSFPIKTGLSDAGSMGSKRMGEKMPDNDTRDMSVINKLSNEGKPKY